MRPPPPLKLREAAPSDAAALAALFLAARAAAMPWLPILYDPAATAVWLRDHVLRGARVLVADGGDAAIGFAAHEAGVLLHLYVAPAAQGQGVGRSLLDAAKTQNPRGLRLFVFQRNTRARRFYEAAGFRLLTLGDGADNEEREPDALYAWTTHPLT